MTVVNTEMAAVWDGEEGDDWTDNADRYDATDRLIAARFDAEVAVDPADRVLDIGCGTGKSTRDAARRACAGTVLGVDLSARMLDEARRRSRLEGFTNVEFLQADAQVHRFDDHRYDVGISVFGAMFFNDPTAAFVNIGGGLRSAGRLALLSWQTFERNEWLTVVVDALRAGRDLPVPSDGEPGPFGLADRDAVVTILRDAGFLDVEMTSINEPMWIGHDGEDAFAFVSGMGFVRGVTDGLEPDVRTAALARLRQTLGDHETANGVLLGSAAWLTTARRP